MADRDTRRSDDAWLGPGEHFTLISELTMTLKSEESAAKYVRDWKEPIEVKMAISYTHALDPARSFKTVRRNLFSKSTVMELDSDFSELAP